MSESFTLIFAIMSLTILGAVGALVMSTVILRTLHPRRRYRKLNSINKTLMIICCCCFVILFTYGAK